MMRFGRPVVLTAQDAYEIRQFRDEGWLRIWGNRAAVALAYNTSPANVTAIGCRDHWFWLAERAS
jgi:hypothetical protein